MPLGQKRPIEQIKDPEIREQVKELQEKSTGEIIDLSATPTASSPLLEDGEWGKDGNDIWIRKGNTLLQYLSDSQISIS